MNQHIILNNVGKAAWLGGVLYIHNLIRAVRALPLHAQPDLTLLLSAHSNDAALYAEVADLINIVFAYPTTAENFLVEARRRLRQFLLGHPYRIAQQIFTQQSPAVLFPLTQVPARPLPIPWVAWAWDLQHKYLPDFFSATECTRRDTILAHMAAQAPLIVTSSADARDDFNRFFPGAQERVRVLRFATSIVPEWYTADLAAICHRYHLPKKFLILPNTFWVHKNHRLAFEAVCQLTPKYPDLCLVCTGGTYDSRHPDHFQSLQRYLAHHQLESHIRILGVIPRADQIQLLRMSSAVLQPSLFEGWSTVVEDARALGKILLLSDLAVHREQNPPRAIFFDPHQIDSLVAVIESCWQTLAPAPDLAQEELARQRQTEIVQAFARKFLSIVGELS